MIKGMETTVRNGVLRRGSYWVLGALFVGTVLFAAHTAHTPKLQAASDEGQQASREGTDFLMRQKLELSQQLLRGLVLEDFPLMRTNATRLGRLSEMTGWQVRNTPEYTGFSAEFRRAADELAYAAGEKNLDGATLAYTQLTYSCVSCHKYMRGRSIQKTSWERD